MQCILLLFQRELMKANWRLSDALDNPRNARERVSEADLTHQVSAEYRSSH